MALEQDKLQGLVTRVVTCGYQVFGSNVASLFSYIEAQAATNPVYERLEAERASKWANWTVEGMGRWKMPIDEADKLSLAWHLFRAAGKLDEAGLGFTQQMYRAGNAQRNIEAFRRDFLPLLAATLTEIGRSQSGPPLDGREKHQKFGILDSPGQLVEDLKAAPGPLGRCLVFFDLDGFKALNSAHTETMVDRHLLPQLQKLILAAVKDVGFAYAQGGDEFVALLPNATPAMGAALAEGLRGLIAEATFDFDGKTARVTASFGVASEGDGEALQFSANQGKAAAKERGKDCVVVVRGGEFTLWRDVCNLTAPAAN